MRMRTELRTLLSVLTFGLLFLAAGSAFAEETPKKAEGKDKSLLDLYQEGGPAMHLIALTSVGTIAIIVFCSMQVNRKKMLPGDTVSVLTQQLAARDLSGAMQLCERSGSILATTLKACLIKANFRREHYNKPAMEQAAADTLAQEETRYMQWINMLNAFATIAPMIGLLATVSGMITSFGTLASGKSEASDLAGGIGEAMVGTASGLLVAIPAMFCYFFFRNKLQSLLTEVQKSVNMLLDVFTGDLVLHNGQVLPAHAFEYETPAEEPEESLA